MPPSGKQCDGGLPATAGGSGADNAFVLLAVVILSPSFQLWLELPTVHRLWPTLIALFILVNFSIFL